MEYTELDKANKELSKTNAELENTNECLKVNMSDVSRQFMADHVQEAIYNFHSDNAKFREKVCAGYELRKALVKTLDESQKNMLYDFIRSLEISTSYLLSEVFREGVKACIVYGKPWNTPITLKPLKQLMSSMGHCLQICTDRY